MNTTYEPDRGPAAQELITVVAHDLRNYLTPLQCRVDLIRRRAIREERHDYLNDSEHAARNLARLRYLIDELLDVSRLERGLFCIQPRPIDIATVVRETAEAFGGAEITIDVVTPPRVVACADAARLKQALENLVGNAIDHSPPGTIVHVQLSTATRDQEAWVEVRVTDDGEGIPPDLLPRLFEPFSTGPGSAGLGLGLYLAQQIAAAHGGSLSVDSRPGEGASFALAWPSHALETRRHATAPVI